MAKKTHKVISEYHLNRHQPDKPQFALYDLNDYIKIHQEDTTRPHIHSFYQIIWFKQGNGTHFVDFKAFDAFANTIFFVAKNQVHYFDKNTDYEGVLIHFNQAFLVQQECEADFLLQCNLFSNPYQLPYCCIDKGILPILTEYILQIRRELENEGQFGQEELLRNYLKSFLIQIQRGKNALDGTRNISFALDEKRLQLARFVNLIDGSYNKGFTVAEYASQLCISPRTLSDLTHQLLGKTPSKMIQERIILEAQRLLLHSSLNVNQVGYRLGFDDPSYFVKYFKKHTQTSPTEFRKSVS